MNNATANLHKLIMLINCLVDAVKGAGDQGAPAGPMYAAMMTYGCRLDQFEMLIDIAVRAGKLRKQGHLLFAL